MDKLMTSIQYIKGVGPKRAQKLRRLNIKNINDLFYFFPKDYEDRSQFTTIRQATIGEKSSFEIEIIGMAKVIRPRRNMSILKIPFKDNSGYGYLTWFNQEYLKQKFKTGERFRVNGKVKKIGLEIQIQNPVFEKIESNNKIGRIIPIYSLTKGLSNNEITKIIENALKENLIYIKESLPNNLKKKYKLLHIKDAIRGIHFPQSNLELEESRKRLVFEELLLLQLGLFLIKNRNIIDEKGINFPKDIDIEEFISSLPFKLTNAQKRVVNEIENDMVSYKQMNRLVQGDVGSGKTIVGAISMFKAAKSGFQSALMAPTEILATQHFESLRSLFEPFNINCELLVGSLSSKKKQEVLNRLKDNEIDILIGTHAIIQEGVDFHNLGLAITDEQHRFGVKQRAILNQKGNNPDIMVMTATPIPRTLALILYGDLDISIIDELPPGRKKVETYAVDNSMLERIYKFIEKQILQGRQVYVVCPLIEESETLDLNSVENLYNQFDKEIFKSFNVALLHGKINTKEKDRIMQEFKDGMIEILVSTTVIEVGVNVPNANTMVIYNGERFGLAQIHQLRGRVGRGEYQSYCIIINESKNKIARERMRILQSSSDGFKISEKDLDLRGPGEFFGTRQHGLPELKIANLIRDMEVLKIVQKEAIEIIKKDPNLNSTEFKVLKQKILELFKNVGDELIFN